MAKEKSLKSGGSGVPQKHLYSRLSFLHQAASYLAVASDPASTGDSSGSGVVSTSAQAIEGKSGSSHDTTRLLTHLRCVSRKSQIRLQPKVKRTICKRCDALLIPGKTSSESIVNSSKGSQKPPADVLEIRCKKCGTVKRFPMEMIKSKETITALTVDR